MHIQMLMESIASPSPPLLDTSGVKVSMVDQKTWEVITPILDVIDDSRHPNDPSPLPMGRLHIVIRGSAAMCGSRY